jgi:integrase
VNRYITPAVGNIQLTKLQPADIDRMLADLTKRGTLSPTTVRYAYSVLRIALGRALKQGRVLRNVATLVDPPTKIRVEHHPLTAEQSRDLIAGTAGDPASDPPVPPDRLHALYALAITTGMRQGELLALRWTDVDLKAGTLAVRHTLQRRTPVLAEPKTDRARRTLRLGPGAIEVLRDHRNRQHLKVGRSWTEESYVFTSRSGTPLDSRNVTQDLQDALTRLDLPRQRFHDLRHAYATLMLEDGEELAVVSRALGHADLSTTADVYAHLTSKMLERAAGRMDRILAPRKAVSG